MTDHRYELSAEDVRELLAELHTRLVGHGLPAAIFVVGGAAIAVGGIRDGRLTEDVDALTRSTEVAVHVRSIAVDRGLPDTWLNGAAAMWMPPLPPCVLDPPASPGLRVTYADDGFLLATKLVAQRARDADDVVALARRTGLGDAGAEQLEQHVRSFYTDVGALGLILGGDVDVELRQLALDAARLLAATRGPR